MAKHGWLKVFFVLLVGSSCWAQKPPESVCEVNVAVPKPGGIKQFEDARKKHNEFHKTEKDPLPILVWQIVTGPAGGNYLMTVCNQTWKGMDARADLTERDLADVAKTMATATAAIQTSYYVLRKDLSIAPETAKEPKMITVTTYFIKPAGLTQFTEALKKINAAMMQTKYPAPPSRWYQLVNGGEGPQFVLVGDRNSWADMQLPEQTLAELLKQVYGEQDKSLETLREAVDHTISELAVLRTDLSYMPANAK